MLCFIGADNTKLFLLSLVFLTLLQFTWILSPTVNYSLYISMQKWHLFLLFHLFKVSSATTFSPSSKPLSPTLPNSQSVQTPVISADSSFSNSLTWAFANPVFLLRYCHHPLSPGVTQSGSGALGNWPKTFEGLQCSWQLSGILQSHLLLYD